MRDIPSLLEGLRRTPLILSEFIYSIPGGKLDVRRGEGFWTIAEHVSHLAQVQPMLYERFDRFDKEEHPVFIPYFPGEGEDEPQTPARMQMDEALEQFNDYRQRQVALLENLETAAWRKTADHPEYETYSLYILTRHTLMHDHWHMYRMEALWLTKNAYLTRLE